ncbi:MAG TPA: hypothetical protein VNM90_14960 [Haliangium sp.]|nr:hypothetical protein [Haliangium sp.]
MPLQRIAALAVLLVHLFASVATGVVYLCQMSGQVGLSACCCQHQRTDGSAGHTDAPDSPDSIWALGCCEATQIEANRAPTLAEKRASEVWPVAVVVLPGPPSLRQHRDTALARPRPDAKNGPSPPDGPPIYLRTRALLL